MVVNPADVPSSDKEKWLKNDKIDARKISRELSAGKLAPIYVPAIEMEQVRSLVRQRSRLVKDQTRCKNRVWHLLMFSGLKLDADRPKQYWSRRFVESLRQLHCWQDLQLILQGIELKSVRFRKRYHRVSTRIC